MFNVKITDSYNWQKDIFERKLKKENESSFRMDRFLIFEHKNYYIKYINNNIIYQYNNHIAPRHCEKIFDFRGNPVLMEIENGN